MANAIPMCIFIPIHMTTHHLSRWLFVNIFFLFVSLSLSLSHLIYKKALFYSRAQSTKSKFPRFIKAQNKEMLHLLRYIAIRVTRLHKMDHNEMMRLFSQKDTMANESKNNSNNNNIDKK